MDIETATGYQLAIVQAIPIRVGHLQATELDPGALEHTLLLKVILVFKPFVNPFVLLTVIKWVAEDKDETSKPASTSRPITGPVLPTGIEEISAQRVIGWIADFQELVHQTSSNAPAFVFGPDEDLEFRRETGRSSIASRASYKRIAQEFL